MLCARHQNINNNYNNNNGNSSSSGSSNNKNKTATEFNVNSLNSNSGYCLFPPSLLTLLIVQKNRSTTFYSVCVWSLVYICEFRSKNTYDNMFLLNRCHRIHVCIVYVCVYCILYIYVKHRKYWRYLNMSNTHYTLQIAYIYSIYIFGMCSHFVCGEPWCAVVFVYFDRT